MTESAKTLLIMDPEAIEGLHKKLDEILSQRSSSSEVQESEWITGKKFMELVSIKAYNTFYNILDKIPASHQRKIGGKIYVHKETIRNYFEGAYQND